MVMAPHSDGTQRPTDQSLNQISLEYGYSELCRATKDWDQDINLIGTGSYGSVYRGVLDDGTEVAIKTLDLPDEGGFAEEVRVLSRFRHPNLVILMGLARHNTQRLLVYELLAGGDAHCRLQQSQTNQRPFPWYQRVSVALDAACGLSHLHHATPKVFHRDIKCPNILIDQNGTAKMADFGLACLDTLGDKIGFRVKQASGTVGYACPIYIQTGVITEGSEVYSFGMVLLELLTANPPAVQQGDGSFAYLSHHLRDDVCRVMALVDPKANWPLEISTSIAQLAIQCISVKEETRTNFRDIVRNLRTIKTSHPPNIVVSPAGTTVSPQTPTRPPVTESDQSSQPHQKKTYQPQAQPAGQQVSPVRKKEHHPTVPLKLQPRQAFVPLQPFPKSAASSARRKSPAPQRRAPGILPMQMFNIGPGVMAGGSSANSTMRWERGDAKTSVANDGSGGGANGGLTRMSSVGRTSGSGSGSGAARPTANSVRPTLFTLEVVFCESADLTTFSASTRCLRHELEEYAASGPFPPFRVGRLFFAQLFEALIPDATLCAVISREHFQVWIDDSLSNVRGPEGTFFLTNFSGNGVKVRDKFVDQRGGQIQLHHGDLISILKNPVAGDPNPLIQFRFDTTGSIITEIPSSLPTGEDEKGPPLYELVFGGPGVAQVTLQDRVVTFRPPQSTTSPFASLVVGRSHQQDLLRRILLEPAYKPIAKTAFEIQAWQAQPLQETDLNAQTSNSNNVPSYHYVIRGLATDCDEKVGFSGGVRADDVNVIEHNESRKIYHQDRIVLNPHSNDIRVVITFFDLSENCRKI
eukprot:GEMP01001481.1.p1 GENE.GEMP01001481.1~~GEMP01001481.1.p1  ORF type:complete len:808 (+),score=149.15 GEMP01001481.1:101-2524(+)